MQIKPPKLLLKLLISSALTALLVKDLSKETSVEGLISIISNTDANSVYIFCLLSLTSLLLRSYRYFYALSISSAKKLDFTRILAITSVRNLSVDLIPARIGELSYFFLLNLYGISLANSSAVFVVCFVLDFLVLAILGLLVLSVSTEMLSIFWLLLTILFSASYLLIKLPQILSFLETRFQKLSALKTVLNSQDLVKLQSLNFLTMLSLLTIALRLAKYSSLFFLLRGVLKGANYDLSKFHPLDCTIAFVLAEASASLPASGIMGFGAYEKAWTAVMNAGNLTSVIFSVHIITQLVTYFLSGLCCLLFMFNEHK